MALKLYAQPVKDSLDVMKGAIDDLVAAEDNDGKIDGKEALQIVGGIIVKMIPAWLPLIAKGFSDTS